jgi:hypothetical protein
MDSPFAQLISSGLPPAAADIPLIRSVVTGARSRVSALDGQIAAMEANLAKLKSDRENAVALAVSHEACLSPHSYYPVEILCEIFRLAVEMTCDPWILGQICRRWRRIALGFPPIWSSIDIDLTPLYDRRQPWPGALTRTSTHLTRSADAPLTLAFRAVRTLEGGVLSNYVAAFLDMLVAHAERWETAYLRIFPEHYAFLAPLHGRLLSLETLTLDVYSTDSQLRAFLIAPKLRNLTLAGVLGVPTAVQLPWHQIIRYTADLEYNHEHLAVFPIFTGVMEARLTLSNLAFTTHEPPRRVSTLQRLYVNRGCLLDLDLPVLDELTFEPLDQESHEEVPLENLLAFLIQSSPRLTKLCLIGRDFSDALLVSVLEQTPALVDLCIQCRHLRNIDLVYLVGVVDFLHAGARTNLPSLQSLTFGGYDFADYIQLADMVESRWRLASQRLTSFGIITRHSPDLSQVSARLETLHEEGMDVLLVDGEGATEAFFSLNFFEVAYARDNKDWSRWQW